MTMAVDELSRTLDALESGLRVRDIATLDLMTCQSDELAHKVLAKREYKQTAAQAKLESVRATFERLSQSEDPEVQRIVAVWSKNLENANRFETLGAERDKRLGELAGREDVTAQHEMLTASYVETVAN
jgi:hypothetical protein